MRRFNLRKSRTWAGIPSTFNKTAKTRSTVTEQPRFNIVCAQKTGRGCTLGRCGPCSKCSYDIFVSDQDIMRYPERGDYVYISGRGSPPNAFGVVLSSTGRYYPDDPPTAYDFNISLDAGRCTMPPIVTCITVLTSCGDLNIHNKALMVDGTQEDCEGASLFHIKKVDEPATKGGNVGAPYRAPLAGARRQGVCCHHDIACLNHRCALVFSIRSVVGAMPTVGALVTTKESVRAAPRRHAPTPQSRPLGTVDKVVKTPGGGVLVIIVYNRDCRNYIYLGESLVIGEKTYDPPVLQFYGTRSWLENCLRQPKKTIRTIYNDNYNKSCAGSSVCYDRRIRSGMQPKQKKCCKIDCTCNSTCRPTPRKYSYSYYQYRQNSACTSFKRSEEKFPYRGLGGSCPPANGNKVPCQKSRYRKSGCQGCDSCDYGADETGRRPFGTAVTTYKPSNKKFQVQGAVTSGGRIERLKLDAIRASASKCPKGKRCTDIQGTKYGKGPYLAGKPAFRGRMYNALHLETTCTRRYKPTPFGIPQLVGNRRRATRNYRLQTVKGNPDKPALGNIVRRGSGSARAPGCKCGVGHTAETLHCPGMANTRSKLCIFDVDNTLSRGTAACTKGNPCTTKSQGGKNNTCACSEKDAYFSCPAVYGKGAYQGCKDRGYNVAIATAEGLPTAVQNCSFLQKEIGVKMPCQKLDNWNENSPLQSDFCGGYDETSCGKQSKCTWTKTPFRSSCKSKPDQFGSIKKPMVNNIMKYYQMDPTKKSDRGRVILFDDDKRNGAMAKNMGIHWQQASVQCKGVYCESGCGTTETNFKDGMVQLTN